MPQIEWTCRRVVAALRRQPLLGGMVAALLLAGALTVAAGTIRGLAQFKDVGYPDSATLLKIGAVLRSGQLYPDIERPPYQVTLYGPLTYILLSFPYAMAQAVAINPQLPVRLCIVGALCACVFLLFLINRRLYNSRLISWLCVLFAVSAAPLADWTTQIRGDLLATGFALMSVYLFVLPNRRWKAIGAAVCAAIAVLIKQTFLAAPVAIICWLIYRRRYKDAAFWATGFAFTVLGGYAVLWWREPLMLQHIAAIRHPVFEYRGALRILWNAVSQPVVPFAALGGFLVLWKRAPERLLFLIYCLVAWLVAVFTIPHVGGNINYFWEPLLASAVLAGPGLCDLQRKANRTSVLVTVMFLVLFLRSFLPTLLYDVRYLRASYQSMSDYRLRQRKWESFVATVSGRKLLSTRPDVTIRGKTPEIPDPYLNSELELRHTWNFGPVVAQIDAGVYDLIVIGQGEADRTEGYRGIRKWSDGMWSATKRRYRPVCAFERMEVWLPHQGSGEILPNLRAIGCLPVVTEAYSRFEFDNQSQ